MKKRILFPMGLCVAVSVLSCGCSRLLDRLTHGRESRNLTQVSSSPEKGTVRGQLMLPSPSMSAPAALGTADVTVVLVDSSMRTIVSRDGSFVFTDVPAGPHTLLAEYSPLWKAW